MLVSGEQLRAAMPGFNLTDRAKFLGEMIDGELVCVVAFDKYNGVNIDAHIVATRITRRMIRSVFEYIFDICGCRRVTSLNDSNDFQMRPYLERLGFRYEGTIRHGLPDGDLIIYGLIREDCKWVKRRQT